MRARQARLADLSDVALLKRLRKSRDWLYAMCMALFQEHGIAVSSDAGRQVYAFDATAVSEQGRTGSMWPLHWRLDHREHPKTQYLPWRQYPEHRTERSKRPVVRLSHRSGSTAPDHLSPSARGPAPAHPLPDSRRGKGCKGAR